MLMLIKPGMIIKTKFQRLRIGIILTIDHPHCSVVCLNSDSKVVVMNGAYIQCLN